MQTGKWKHFFCTKQGNCEIRLKTRKKCQLCRYQACLAAGMKTNWVLNEEEKERFLNSRRKEHKSHSPNLKPRTLPSLSYISDEEMSEVNEFVNISEYFELSKVKDMGTGLIREVIR